MRCARGSHRLQKRQEQARGILARISRTLDSASSSVGPPGRSSTVGPDRGVEGASERWSPPGNGDHRASSHRADDSPHPSRARLPLAGHVPRRNASTRVTASEKLRASRETGKCKVGRASRVIGESISMTRFEPSPKAARSEASRSGIRWDLRVPSKHPSFADDVDEHLVSRLRFRPWRGTSRCRHPAVDGDRGFPTTCGKGVGYAFLLGGRDLRRCRFGAPRRGEATVTK